MRRTTFASLAILALLFQPALAEPPESAHIDVPNLEGVSGACYMNSLGELVSYANPELTMHDVFTLSGIGTSVGWGGPRGQEGLCAHPRGFTEGIKVDLLRLCGADFEVCYGRKGAVGSVLLRAAHGVTLFDSEAEAVTKLKTLLAAGTPVQVHVDMYYIWDDLAAAYPYWTPGAKLHGSHSGVLNGYDADYVYYTDSGPIGEHGETGENIPITWDSFLTAWRETPNLSPIKGYWFGPYFICYLTSTPVKVDDEWVTAWLGLDCMEPVGNLVVGPDAVRAAADALRNGRPFTSVVPGLGGGVMTFSRVFVASYFEDAGRADIAALYTGSTDLLESIMADLMDPSITDLADVIADKTDAIAANEEAAINLMAAVAPSVQPLRALLPADAANISSFDDVTFHWLCLPTVEKPVLEIAMTGDFSDAKTVARFTPRFGNWFVTLGPKEWLKILQKDGGDRKLSWRVVGRQGRTLVQSASFDLTWEEQSFSTTSPSDNYSFPEDELVQFTWQAPAIALRPRVALSTSGDFSDPKHTVYLTPARGASQTAFRRTTLAGLVAKDDGDKVVYWRVEDASAKLTTVEPSETRTLNLP